MKQIVCLLHLNITKNSLVMDSLRPDESLSFLIKFIPFTEVRGTANTILKD